MIGSNETQFRYSGAPSSCTLPFRERPENSVFANRQMLIVVVA